uniref:Uncharacterized protein n=1 Tax=Caldicellulosiruptor owensensis TaxID=55205 RepID=A0A7C5Z493_9FIRM
MLKYNGQKLTSLKELSLIELANFQRELSILIGKISFYKEYGIFPETQKGKLEFDVERFKTLEKKQQQDILNKLQLLYQLIDIITIQLSNIAKDFARIEEILCLVSPPVEPAEKKTA